MADPGKEHSKAFIIINPVAGFINAKTMKRIITDHFIRLEWETTVHLTEMDDDLTALVKKRLEGGIDMVVVAGGDGTIASVAAGMVDSGVPLGIIPAGTWNAIARHLMLPFNPVRALSIMTGKHKVRYLDLMSIGTSVHAMNLSVGLSARMIKSTSRETKRKFGNLAYFKNLQIGRASCRERV